VLLQPEDVAAVEPDALEHAVAVEQPVVEHRHLGVGLVHEFAIEIDLHARRLNSAQSLVEFLEFGFFCPNSLSMSTAPFAPASQHTYVIGHRNPDADAICSAIAYAAYKEARGEGLRGGPLRQLERPDRHDPQRFRQPLPVYVSDVWPRVRDLMEATSSRSPRTPPAPRPSS
jgi:hypothetical protein